MNEKNRSSLLVEAHYRFLSITQPSFYYELVG
jgi:hypothetical protein